MLPFEIVIYAVAVNVVFAGQLAIYIPFVKESVVVAGTRVFGHVGAVTPGVRGIPGLGSYRQANAAKEAEKRTLAAIPAAGGPFESSNVIGVFKSVAVFVHWLTVIRLMAPAPVTGVVPTAAELIVRAD
jgi:hypothetical protein